MRIAFFVWEYWPRLVGGLGSYAIEMTKKLKELGNEVVVFTLNNGSLKTKEEWNGIEIHRPLIVDMSDLFPLFVTEDLKKWGKNIKLFSDIFCYNLLSASKFVNLLIRKEGRRFDLIAIHDWLSSLAGLSIKEELPDLPIAFHMHSVEEQRSLGAGSEVIKHLERRMGEMCDQIITVSYSMRDFLSSIGYPTNKIEVCYNGCDPEKYCLENVDWKLVDELRRRYEVKNDEKVIFFIGRLTWIKGVHNLIKAMPIVLEEFPEAKLIILGKGEEYEHLVLEAQQLGLYGSKIQIRSEWVSERERIAHYAMADVCVFPSIAEPFGIVSLEAMAMERPVVVGASGVSGLKEQVIATGEKRTGVHIDGNNPEDIAWGIKEVFKDWERARRWGKNGRERVINNFTWDIAAKRTLEIYERLIR